MEIGYVILAFLYSCLKGNLEDEKAISMLTKRSSVLTLYREHKSA